ncbi:hypothetical protein F442_10262 [Phytophthora nicotianae P10297]|uniref:BZIP domain-containing protein n=1 Tax=Phytophthora nicotianae P10297 TaxID=1317064 RepID=W2Z656_PHYNI|nr:hypothetical protein F442_10262 [Phytophthora nicotianae P10297]
MSQQPDTRKLPFPDEIKANIAAYHRERRRKNQARYRAKQHQLITDQEAYNSELQQEIVELRWKRETLMLDITRRDSVWAVAVKYFSVFRLGLDTAGGACTTTLDFLRATMAPDLDAGTVFRDIQIRLGRLDQISENSLVAYCTTSITITRSTLSSLFPRLVDQCFNHNNTSKCYRIADRPVGQRLVLYGSVRFTWDTTNNCVTSLITKADMLSPLLRLLGNLEDVSLVFRHARINPECNLVVNSYANQHSHFY